MDVTFSRGVLYDAVHAVSGALNARAPKPALQCVHFKTDRGAVVVSATDLRIAIRRRVDAAAIRAEGEAAVQGLRLGALLREVTDDEVRLQVDKELAGVVAGRSSFKLVAADPADFAELPRFGRPDVRLNAQALEPLVRRTVFATAQEQGRYAIDGILLAVSDRKVELAATDGRRLAVATGEAGEGNLGPCIVPPKMLSEIVRHAAGAGEIDLALDAGRLLARAGDTLVAGAVLEGSFPPYQDMIPNRAEPVIRARASALASKLRQAAQLTTEDSRAVVIALSAGRLRVEARSAGVGEADVEMDVGYDGGETRLAFNARYLLDVLPEFGDEEMEIEVPAADRPAVIRKNDYVYVLAPVRLAE